MVAEGPLVPPPSRRESVSLETRLTTEESRRVIDLAVRLQAEHEGTVAVGDLARAAEESGIEARFVHEALTRLGAESPPDRLSLAWVPMILFPVQAALLLASNFPGSYGHRSVTLHEAMIALVVSFLLAIWTAQRPAFRWVPPIASAGTWVLTGAAYSFYLNQSFIAASWVPGVATIFGLVQTAAALFGAVAAARIERLHRASGGQRVPERP